MTDLATRQALYRQIETARGSRVLAMVHGDRPGLETTLAPDQVPLLVELLDQIGAVGRLSLILTTNGGHTSTAWRAINLLRAYCDDLEILIPLRALSAGTLMCLGADRIIMTRQAVLGPIDPSVRHPLGPATPGAPDLRQPVSVEAVQSYLDIATRTLGIREPSDLVQVLRTLSDHIHPLVLGEIFRTRAQIRFLAEQLLRGQVTDPARVQSIIDFLCADSGSHDYSIDGEEAARLGLTVEAPSAELQHLLGAVHQSCSAEMRLNEPSSAPLMPADAAGIPYQHRRALLESTAGAFAYVSEGVLHRTRTPNDTSPSGSLQDVKVLEGWQRAD